MSRHPDPETGVLWRAVLIVSILVLAHVLYAVEHGGARLTLGLVLLAPIVWAATRVELVDRLKAELAGRPRRRYKRLRVNVVKFLSEVQRLNWLAVDGQRIAGDRSHIDHEMDAVEQRMNGLVRSIRDAAGDVGRG